MQPSPRGVLLLVSVSLLVAPCAWAHTDVTVAGARDLVDTVDDLIVVDVREPYEYCDAQGHIPGALNYPLSSGVLQTRYEELPTDRPILVVCRSGGRSNQAANFLDSQGFAMVYDMMGGMSAWTGETTPCKYSGGSGTADDPYQIATAADLIALGETRDDYDKHFMLTADIDLDPNLPGRKIFDRAVIAPYRVGIFSGVFDGKGHTISHLTINGDGHELGLFGRLRYGSTVSNLGLDAIRVEGEDYSSYVGGLVGYNFGNITSCYSSGSVTGHQTVGGLVGVNVGSITSSYSTASVTGYDVVGGLAGGNEGSITSSYSAGLVTGSRIVGGLVGGDGGTISTSLWDVETSGLTIRGGGVGLTTAEMMDSYVLGLNGFADDPNWVLDVGHDYPRLAWEGTVGQIIPEPVVDWLEGRGTEEAPYRIDTAHQLILLTRAAGLWDKHFILGADIDLDPNLPGSRVFSQGVFQAFSGVFEGNGHTISHLTVTGHSYLGLFGKLGSGATVSNLGLEVVDVNGIGACSGGLVGFNYGTIAACYSTGSVTGDAGVVGGLVGYNVGSITASYSTSTSSVTGAIGGLVGLNDGSITSCYSTGSVTGYGRSVGGLVGDGRGTVTACFWDMETSGQTDWWPGSENGTGLTTAEMQAAGTFLDADWDFVGETENGTDDIWWIDEGLGYPRLWWELEN